MLSLGSSPVFLHELFFTSGASIHTMVINILSKHYCFYLKLLYYLCILPMYSLLNNSYRFETFNIWTIFRVLTIYNLIIYLDNLIASPKAIPEHYTSFLIYECTNHYHHIIISALLHSGWQSFIIHVPCKIKIDVFKITNSCLKLTQIPMTLQPEIHPSYSTMLPYYS